MVFGIDGVAGNARQVFPFRRVVAIAADVSPTPSEGHRSVCC